MARPKKDENKEVQSDNVELNTPQTDNQIEQNTDETQKQVVNDTTTQDANVTLEQNNDQTDDTSEKSSKDGITVLQFRSMAVTYPDVNGLFQKEKGNLKNPKAVAEDMRRLGHHVDYE